MIGGMISKFCVWVSWLAVVLAAVATVWWIGVVADGNYCWAAFGFEMCLGTSNVGILLLGVIPSGVRYYRKRERRDLTSLWLAGTAFVILLTEMILLEIIPMRGE
jgi:hypothetical protein